MTRIKVLGACLVVAVALSATVVAAAQAKRSEHGAIKFESASGAVELVTAAPATVNCVAEEGKGEITSATAGTMSETLTGCESVGQKCSNTATAGTVESKLLALGVGWISKTKGEAGVDVKGSGVGEYLFEFECGGTSVKVKRSVIGLATPLNVQSASGFDLTFSGSGTKQEPEKSEGGSVDTLQTEIGGLGPFESRLSQTLSIRPRGGCKVHKGKETCKPGQAELNTVANGVQAQFGRCAKKHKSGKFGEANCATLAAPGKGNFEFVPIPG
jgi:hypothetical protein